MADSARPAEDPTSAPPALARFVLTGGVVADRAEIRRIRARMRYARLPWWRRLVARAPEGW